MISFGSHLVFIISVLGTTITGKLTPKEIIDFKKEIIKLHNDKRAEHGSNPLFYDPILSYHAEEIILSKKPEDINHPLGLNVYTWKKPNKDSKPDAAYVFSKLYNMGNNYNYDIEPSITDTKVPIAFTQIVWKGSKQLGISIINGDDKCIIAITYHPRGNEIGKFKANVKRPENRESSSSIIN